MCCAVIVWISVTVRNNLCYPDYHSVFKVGDVLGAICACRVYDYGCRLNYEVMRRGNFQGNKFGNSTRKCDETADEMSIALTTGMEAGIVTLRWEKM